MSKDRLKNLIKLIAVCAVAVVLTVLAVVYVLQDNAYAWFSKNNLVTANGMEVAITVDDSVVASVEYFTINGKSGGSYTFTPPEGNATNSTKMGTYKSSEGNVYQVIVKINLTETVDSVTVYANTTAYKYLGADDADTITSANGNSLSSVVAFEIYHSDTIVDGTAVVTEITDMEGATTAITLTPPTTVTEYSFVENKQLISSVPIGERHTFTSQSKAVYIVIKYNVNAITEVFGHNIGNPICNSEVDFDKYDFSFSIY